MFQTIHSLLNITMYRRRHHQQHPFLYIVRFKVAQKDVRKWMKRREVRKNFHSHPRPFTPFYFLSSFQNCAAWTTSTHGRGGERICLFMFSVFNVLKLKFLEFSRNFVLKAMCLHFRRGKCSIFHLFVCCFEYFLILETGFSIHLCLLSTWKFVKKI